MLTPINNKGSQILLRVCQPPTIKATEAPTSIPVRARKIAAGEASTSHRRSVTAIMALKEAPKEPKVTAHVCPKDGITTARSGENPKPTRMGAIQGHCQATEEDVSHYKYGYKVPKDYEHAVALDKRNGNAKWQDAMGLKMLLLDEYEVFKDLGYKANASEGYKKI